MPQNPPERVDAPARGQGIPVPGAGREGRGLHPITTGTFPARTVPRFEVVRCVLEEHAGGDGEEGRNQDTLGDGHRRVRRGER